MKFFGDTLSEKHLRLSKLIRKKDSLEQAKALFFEIHSAVNMPCVYGTSENEVSALLEGLSASDFSVMPGSKDDTIAWSLWHIARIEDLTINMLIARGDQLFDTFRAEKIGSPITDTGNALSDDEMVSFSKTVNIEALIDYRNAVAARTKEVVQGLSADDMRRKVASADTERIAECGGVTSQDDSRWLLDYWAGKDTAGLLLMPPTRHALLHLNNCARIKAQLGTKKSFYRC